MLSGKAKIEGLTNAWYGFDVFAALCSLFMSGVGLVSASLAFGGLLVSWIVTFLIGRALLRRSSLTRFILVLFSGLFAVLGVLGTAKGAWSFVHMWRLSVLAYAAYMAAFTWMQARSFRTLMDRSVRAYFG